MNRTDDGRRPERRAPLRGGSQPAARRALLIIAVGTCYRLAFIGCFSASPDEASYWDWSRHLDYGYVDHPPLVAYVIFCLRLVAGECVPCWRLFSVVVTAVCAWLLFCTGRRLYGAQAGLWAVAAHSLSPMFSFGAACLVLPETLLSLWSCLALWLAARMLSAPTSGSFFWLGLTMGAGLLSKWPAAMLPAAVLLLVLLSAKQRCWLRRKEFWCMLIIPVLMLAPILIWNMRHDWASWTFAHARTSPGVADFQWRRLWEALLGQAAYHSPLMAIACWWALMRAARQGLFGGDERAVLLLCFGGPMLLAFLCASGWRTTLPHWTSAAYLPAVVALGGAWAQPRFSLSRWRQAARGTTLALGAVACVLAPLIMFFPITTLVYQRFRPHLGLPADVIEPMAHAVGWDLEIRDALVRVVQRVQAETSQHPIVLTPLNTLTAMLAFHLRDVCSVASLHAGAHQYDIWFKDRDLEHRPVLFVRSSAFFLSSGSGQPQDYYVFEHCKPAAEVSVQRSGVEINRVEVWSCAGYGGPVKHP